MIKIAYVINYIVNNGPSKVVLNIMDNLDRTKFEPSLITLFPENDADIVKKLRSRGITVLECSSMSRAKCILGQDKEFQNIVKNGHFDVLHTHGLIPDILCARLKLSIKKITTVHNNMYEDYLTSYGNVKGRVFVFLHLMAMKRLDTCVCCAESVYQVLKPKLNNVSFIRNGIEPVCTQSKLTRKECGIPETAKVFLYAGALNAGKNVVSLVENFVNAHTADEYLLILGTGEKEAECEAKADSHVKMFGFQSDPLSYMQISDVYVSASKSEGFSISVLEALASGLGLLLSDIPSHREVVALGKDVYLGEIFTQQNFAEKLESMRYKELEKGKIRAFQNNYLSARVMAKQYALYYEKGM